MLKKIKLFFIIIIVLAIIFAIYFVNSLFAPASEESQLIYFQVERGQGVKQISDNLKDHELIRSKFIFKTYVKLKGAQTKLLAGEHKLSTDMNVREILNVLIAGSTVNNEEKIIIIEGWRADEIGEYLEKQRLVTKQEFLTAIKISNWRGDYDFLAGIKTDTVEGFLFPDTYRVFTDIKVEDIVKKLLDNFNSKLTQEMKDEIKKKNDVINDVIILASIVEREARTEEDMRMVADVFLKRLDLNMGLQSDATINYITGKGDLRPRSTDLQIDSPYNTYKYSGLPPGPISNPGLTAIKAVIYPQKNNYYFFLMDMDGNTHYAETFDEHQSNIRLYLN